jgi:hypothetical protein
LLSPHIFLSSASHSPLCRVARSPTVVGVQVSLQASHNILFSGRDVLFSLTIDLIGNIHTDGKPPMPADLVTPTIKQDFYTTGRGGSGNMMFNDKDRPEIARGSQDVEEPPKRSLESVQFTGRGMFSFVFPPHSNLMLTHNVFPQVVSPTLSSLASKSKRPKTPPLPSVLGNSETEYRRKNGPRKFLAARLPRHEKQNRGLDREHCPLFSFFGCLFFFLLGCWDTLFQAHWRIMGAFPG